MRTERTTATRDGVIETTTDVRSPLQRTGICPAAAAGLVALALAAGACADANRVIEMGVEDAPVVPPVRGYAAGEEILFLHTETSDPEIARTLTDMMRSPVLVVPELAASGDALLADVYVFANGVQPEVQGPLGYQGDVFDCPPGQPCYRPLRRVNLVTWSDPGSARILRSAEEVRAAVEAGELRVERPGVVVNMPLIRWPGGER